MSAPQNNNAATNNPSTADPKDAGDKATENNKPAAALEEDDEFEDFPSEDWDTEDAELPAAAAANSHLWEESWDDDDTSEDFSAQLKEELKKVDQKRA
ncbi:DSS1/SEM1 family-domain-containing protein [Phyllosticta citribraziliensis]|uniref:26S proteasome complex subunit SEM1 n=2 Tax=Phyllosticta TaxID=121621 RepID=A0ABR1XTX9_9PEZI